MSALKDGVKKNALKSFENFRYKDAIFWLAESDCEIEIVKFI